ncbi:MAG: ATP-binding cassette, subfamily bacterial, partial [Candidatus Hydrogenedentes bacterium]|nr:ATP-binding cassette, subfamily bacterial [Candidatus Hydrogenedentota bacterium]
MIKPPGSQIRSTLPPLVEKALKERDIVNADVVIATNTDLDIIGEYSESWLIATKEVVLVYLVDEDAQEALLVRELPVEQIESVRTDSRVGSGFLEAKTRENVYTELVRFSNKNSEKFGKVAAKIKSLAEGKQVVVRPEEEEELVMGRCQKCGVRLPDRHMTICPKCMKRGLVFTRFLGRTRSYWPYMAVMMLLVVATILLSLVPAQLTRILLDNVFGDRPVVPWFRFLTDLFDITSKMHWLYLVVGCLVVTTVATSIVSWIRERLACSVSNRLGFELRDDVFRKLEDLAVHYHDTHPVGQLMTRCTQDVEVLQNFINQLTGGFGYQTVMVVAVSVTMFMTNWKLGLIACLPAPAVMACTVAYYRFIVPRWNKYWTTRSNLSNVLHASLSGVRVVKAFAQEVRESERFGQYSGKFRDAGLDVGYSQALFYPTMGFVFQLGSYFIWIYGGSLVLNVDMTIGELVMFLNYLGMFYGPLNSLTQMSAWFTSFTTQAHRVFEVLDHEPEIRETSESVDIEIQGAIRFENVGFGYDPHIPILHDVSFAVRPGEMVGIVGHSGSGKSTTINLVMRFYEAGEGSITVDNIDIRRIRKTCLRRQIGLVAQDPFLFGGTIAENIAYGNPSVAPEQILDSALAANAHMFITRIHDGYDTRLGERGSGLSGGERQRVAIARGLLHNPRVLILDEATSSVDTIAEREIQKALEALSLGRTTVVIAHRLSTLRNCDRIIVFEEGRIREMGTHEELMEKKGIYHKLVQIQTQLTSDRETTVDSLNALEELEKAEEVKKVVTGEVKERRRGVVPHIRYLDPKQLRVYSLDEGGMRVTYGEESYLYVHAYRCYPISRPSEFVALWTGASALEHEQIGVVRYLKELEPASRKAVEKELAKRYFIHYVRKINSIKEELGFLFWDVESDKGRMEFLTRRWDRDTVFEGGANGRVILDIDKDRYEIENL